MEMRNLVLSDGSSSCSSDFSNLSESNRNDTLYRFLNYSIVPGYCANSKLLYSIDEKQFYMFNCVSKNGDSYLYIEHKKRKCKCRVFVRKDKLCIQKLEANKHTHETKEKTFEELQVLNII